MDREIISTRKIQVMNSKEELIEVTQHLIRKTVYKLYRPDAQSVEGKVCIDKDEFGRNRLDARVRRQEDIINRVKSGTLDPSYDYFTANFGNFWVEKEIIECWQ